MLQYTSERLGNELLERFNWIQGRLLSMDPETPLKDLLTVIAETANQILNGHFCVVQPYDQQRQTFLVEQFTPGGDAAAKTFAWTQPRPNGSAYTTLRDGLLMIEDYNQGVEKYPFLVDSSTYRKGAFKDVADVKASIGIRLEAGGEVVGILFVNYPEPHTFSVLEIEIARLLGSQAAFAILQARRFEILKQISQKDLNLVIDVTQKLFREALQPETDLEIFLQSVLKQTLNLLPFSAGWLLLREGDWVRVVATDENHIEDVGRSFQLQDSISGLSVLNGQVINLPDLSNIPDEYRRIYKAPRGSMVMQSELAVPLMVGNNAIGSFNIEAEQKQAFTPFAVELIQLVSNQVALAVELARSRQEAAALSSLSLDLSQKTEMSTTISSVLEHALRLVGARFGQVLLREGDRLVVRHTTNTPPNDLNYTVGVQDSISGLAVISKSPVIMPNVGALDYYVANLVDASLSRHSELIHYKMDRSRFHRALEASKQAIQAEFALPILNAGEVIGVLNIETPVETGLSTRQRDELIKFVESHAEELDEALSGHHTPVLARLLQGALTRTNLDKGFGQILSSDGEDLVIEATTGGERQGTHVQIEKSVTGRAVKNKAPVYVPRVAEDPDYQRYLGEEMKSELVVPLSLGEEVIGVINLESPAIGFFTNDHARLLQTFAPYASVAIDRARIVDQSKQAQVGVLAGDIVHRLNNPLGAMSMRSEILQTKSEYREVLEKHPSFKVFFDVLDQELVKAKAIVQELRKELKGADPEPTDLLPAIKAALQQVESEHSTEFRQIEVALAVCDDHLQVMADDRLVSVFWNLFDNARKAMPQPGRLAITVNVSDDRRLVIVEVEDSGRGIEPYRLEHIFKSDESTTEDPNAPAHGLGLWWVKNQIDRYGGSIDVRSQLGAGTHITLKLRHALNQL